MLWGSDDLYPKTDGCHTQARQTEHDGASRQGKNRNEEGVNQSKEAAACQDGPTLSSFDIHIVRVGDSDGDEE
jgi:hypothetical protein